MAGDPNEPATAWPPLFIRRARTSYLQFAKQMATTPRRFFFRFPFFLVAGLPAGTVALSVAAVRFPGLMRRVLGFPAPPALDNGRLPARTADDMLEVRLQARQHVSKSARAVAVQQSQQYISCRAVGPSIHSLAPVPARKPDSQ